MLVLLVLGLIGPGFERTGPARSFVPDPYPAAGVIRFANGTVLDTDSSPGCRPGDLLPAGSIWLLCIDRPPDAGLRHGLVASGLEPLAYYQPQAIACRAPATVSAGRALALRGVGRLVPLPERVRLAPELLGTPVEGPYTAGLWPGADPSPLLAAIHAAGGTVERMTGRTVRFSMPATQVTALAALDAVEWLQACDPVTGFNASVQWVIQSGRHPVEPDPVSGRPAWQRGLRGQGEVAGLVGTGIDVNHDQFFDPLFPLFAEGIYPRHRKIAAYKLYPSARFGDPNSFHGSGVAGTLCGNDSACGNLVKCDGVAPDARVYFLDVANSLGGYVIDDDYTELLDSVWMSAGMPERVTTLSGSFGSVTRTGYYRIEEATLDNVAWQHPWFSIIWAAGNSGGSQYRIGHPSCAKNCLTVGATGNGVQADRVADFSSRGPTRDLRIKPEVVAPGEAVTTVDGPGERDYSSRSGTSYSSPAAHGAMTILRQYLREGWFPTGMPDPAHRLEGLSAAFYRAFAILAADPAVGSDPVPNDAAGWGRLNLSRILRFAGDTLSLSFVDDSVGLSTASLHEYRLVVTDRRPLTLVLAWTDTAAAPEAEIALVNDLDLELVSPDGNRYRGNRMFEGQSSANPLTWDSRNNHEVFHLQRPLAGEWFVRVRGRSVFTSSQPYALALRGTIDGLPGLAGTGNATSAPRLPTIARGSLVLPSAFGTLTSDFILMDVSGRRVMELRPGENNVSHLAPGIYFARPAGGSPQRIVLVN